MNKGRNILYFPQLSMYDKNERKFIPEADGNLNMMRNFINEWQSFNHTDIFFIVLPDKVETIEWFFKFKKEAEEKHHKIVALSYNNYVYSARVNRFNFSMGELTKIIGSKQLAYGTIDLVINDVPELTQNILSMFEIHYGYKPRIISNIRHVDEPGKKQKIDYTWRIIEALDYSDFVTILSQSMKNKLYETIEKYIEWGFAKDLISKIHVFEPSISMKEIEKYMGMAKIRDLRKPVITFPGRLSKGEEGRTNWDKFLDAIQEVQDEQGFEFDLYLTDPNNAARFDNKADNVHFIEKDRDQFLRLLHKTDIIVSLMDVEGFGGISIREALLFGAMPVIPYVDEYKWMQLGDYKGFVESPITVEDLKDKLTWAISNYREFSRYDQHLMARKYSIEYQMPMLLNELKKREVI